jgi:hypothetical protein
MTDAIDVLAEHFTGPLVAHNSICLQLGAPHATMARKFFETRKALGIEGYASKDQALAALRSALTTAESGAK